MRHSILSDIICHEFEKVVGRDQQQTGRAMHIGFHLSSTAEDPNDQYRVMHMYIWAPMNYVYVAVQEERITEYGERVVGEMELMSCHDSCWRSDGVSAFLWDHKAEVSSLSAFVSLVDWYDVMVLTAEEQNYLSELENWKRDRHGKDEMFKVPNPFDKRGFWVEK